MKIEGSVALVTGANRGLGAEFCRQLLERGAAKVYGAARDLDLLRDDRVVPVGLDVTDQDSIKAASSIATDVTLLVNNAGIMTRARVLGEEGELRREIEVNYLGTVAVTCAFAPILASNGGGAVINDQGCRSPKSAPSDVAAKALEGLEAGEQEVLADDTSRHVKAALAGPPSNLYPTVA